MTTFGGDSPDVVDAVTRARQRARRVQTWIDRLLEVAPPKPDDQPEDNDAQIHTD